MKLFFAVETKLWPANFISGMIAALKSEYRRKKVNLGLDNSDSRYKLIYDVDQLTAVKWANQIWEELKQEIVYNYWFNTGLIAASNSVLKNLD